MVTFKNIRNSGIASTIEVCLDYVGTTSQNAYKLEIEEFERDFYGDRKRVIKRLPIKIFLGKQLTDLEMVEGGEKPLTRIRFNAAVDTNLREGDQVEIDGIGFIVDNLLEVSIGDSVVVLGGILVRRRD